MKKIKVSFTFEIDLEKYIEDHDDCTKKEAIEQIKEHVESAGLYEFICNGYIIQKIYNDKSA
jgi:hypothetical protein